MVNIKRSRWIIDLIVYILIFSNLISLSYPLHEGRNSLNLINKESISLDGTDRVVMMSHKLTYLKDYLSDDVSNDVGDKVTSCMNCTEEKRVRNKRALFSLSDRDTILQRHNNLRRQEGSSNMQFLTWNSALESLANDWAAGCNFVHGQPSRSSGSVPFNPIGQNLYAVSGVQNLDVSSAIDGWYNEKSSYNYNSGGCSSTTDGCGHYTQIVWADTRQVGCAYFQCRSLSSSSLSNAFYFVCNYGPAGNYVGEKPYLKGSPCSQCTGGLAWCDDALCRPDCSSGNSACQCSFSCANCGELDKTSCQCKCQTGWYGNDCSTECRDLDTRCNGNPGWPPKFCNHAQYQDQIRKSCPAMCGLCTFTKNPVRCGRSSSSVFGQNHQFIITALALLLF